MNFLNKNWSSLFLAAISLLILVIVLILLLFMGSMSDTPIPYSGLLPQVHYPLFALIIPSLASIIFVIIFPRVGVPIFLKLKSIFWKKYRNTYIDLEFKPICIKRFLIRSVFVFLLTMGLLSTLSPFIDYSLFIDSITYDNLLEEGFPLNYSMDILAGVGTLILPFSIGLWAIGWALEDAGLIHFHLPKTDRTYYEIEPIYFKYDSYIGGFAGIAAILYYLGAITIYFEDFQNLFWSVMVFIIVIGMNGLSYVFYNRFGVKFARRKINPSKFQKATFMDHNP